MISLEETITNFKRDANPDTEIVVWLQMAESYERYLRSRKGKLDRTTKKEVFYSILSQSMMLGEEATGSSKLPISLKVVRHQYRMSS